VQAVLLDSEARAEPSGNFGKLREPLLQLTHLWRACGAAAASGRYAYFYPENDLDQGPLRSPTVFNFFRPGYAPPGALKSAGLVAPEMQLVNAATVPQLNNRLASFIFGMDRDLVNGADPDDILLDLSSFKALAGNLPALLDLLNLVFLSGQMPAAMRTTLQTYLATLDPVDGGGSLRVQEALYLIMTSSQYATQR
jgi:hypothetical protein